MIDQKETTMSETNSKVVDWDTYLKEKMIELRRLLDESDKGMVKN